MVELKAGDRAAWFRGPSRTLVIGVIVREAAISPQKWASRSLVGAAHEAAAVSQKIWECTEERTIGGTSAPGATWLVAECDLQEYLP